MQNALHKLRKKIMSSTSTLITIRRGHLFQYVIPVLTGYVNRAYVLKLRFFALSCFILFYYVLSLHVEKNLTLLLLMERVIQWIIVQINLQYLSSQIVDQINSCWIREFIRCRLLFGQTFIFRENIIKFWRHVTFGSDIAMS